MARTIWNKAKSSLNKLSPLIRILGLGYLLLVLLVLLLFIGIYVYEVIIGKSLSKDLLPFIQVLLGSGAIGFVTFLCGLCIDVNGNGISDILEREERR